MINLMEKSKIISKHIKGDSNRQIAKDLGINRGTVNKYVNEYEQLQKQLLACSSNELQKHHEIADQIVSAPAYKSSKRPSRKYTAQIDARLNEILEAEKQKRSSLGYSNKQMLTKYQIHGILRDEGYDIGYTTICTKINEKRQKPKEAFISQSYQFGQRFEYDFGNVKLYIGNKLTVLHLAVMSAPASKYRFALLYDNTKYDVFIDSQVRFFEHLGGCFKEGVYDNMRNVVSKFIGPNEKKINPQLLGFAAYYGFNVNVTNCYSGNEKGSVESSVKVIRRAAFATHWKFDSMQQAQQHLDQVLSLLNKSSLIEEEKHHLLPYRVPFETADIRPGANVDKYSCVCVDGNYYSVPESLVQKKVLLKIYPNEIVVMFNHKTVARHIRQPKKSGMYLDIFHYLDTFRKKPGALTNSTVLQSYPRFLELFNTYYKENPKEFIEILRAHNGASLKEVESALINNTSRRDQHSFTKAQPSALETQTLKQINKAMLIRKKVCCAS